MTYYKRNSGSAVAALLNPSQGIRDDMKRKGIKPKDYISQNKKVIDEIESKTQERKEFEELIKNRKLYKMKEFEEVEPRIEKEMDDEKYHPKEKHEFLKKTEKPLPAPSKPFVRKEERKPSVPSAVVKKEIPPPPKDFITVNKSKALKMEPKKFEPKPLVPPVDPAHQKGQIPDYLIKRKIQQNKDAERRLRNMPDPDCPPGMVLLPDDERVSTLKTLEETAAQIEESLRRMPLVIETPSMIRRQKELEEKLKETKDAIKIFSQSKVFVMPD